MKKSSLITLSVILGLILITVMFFFNAQANLNKLDQDVRESAANIDTNYQRRFDLLPNMVEVVKRYASHEQQVFKDIADARTNYSGSSKGSSERVQAMNQLDKSFSRLMVIVENYPNLKANEQFTRLMDQWEGTENRINVARTRYNDKVKQYNYKARSIMGRFWVSMFDFDSEKPFFEATKGAEKAPSAKDAWKD